MKINIEKYLDFKDSGVEWLGEIPSHWGVMSFRHCITKLTDYTSNGSFASLANNVEYLSEGYSRLVRLTDLRVKLKNDGVFVSEKAHNFLSNSELFGDELLIANVGAYAGLAEIMPKLNYKSTLGPNMFLLRLNKNVRYFYYLLNSSYYSKFLSNIALSSAQPKLNKENIRDIKVIAPSIKEQIAIASFLDRKTALIDQAITIKQQQIELLKERRQILIHKAVTRGLNPTIKMKDSGVEWIGEIPEGWEVKKLRYLANCFPSNVDKHSKPNEKEVRLCNYTDVYKNDYITDDMDLMIATASDDQINKFLLSKGDIVITKDSETANDIAVPTYIKEKLTNVVCGYHLAVIRTYNASYSKYLFHALKTKLFNVQFELCSNGITRVGLGNSDLKNGIFLVPSVKEQIEIAEYIEHATTKIATAISLKEQEIEGLKEYKATLINGAVTGKVKVG